METSDANVERLANYIMEVVAECFEEEDVTTQEVIVALSVVLEGTFRGIRKFQEADERFVNAELIRNNLNDLMVEFGRVPS